MLLKAKLFTTVGKKVVMAVTGLALCVFLVGHLAGNLQLLWNHPLFNAYAHFLTVNMKVFTYAFEIGLLAIFVLHIADAILLAKVNSAARPIGYVKTAWGKSKSPKSRKSWSSTFMMWSGIAILLFTIFHVWHLKFLNPVASTVPPPQPITSSLSVPSDPHGGERTDLALMVVNEFQNPLVAGFYILMMGILGAHLYHAVSSALTSLGANHPRFSKGVVWLGRAFTIVVCGGFASIPLLILFRLVKSPV